MICYIIRLMIRVDLRAGWSTFAVHFGTLLLMVAATPMNSAESRGSNQSSDVGRFRQLASPRIFVATRLERAGPSAANVRYAEPLLAVESPCPESEAVTLGAVWPARSAQADPLAWLSPIGENGIVCAWIDRSGRARRIFLAQTSGDAADDRRLLRTILRLRMEPARRGDDPVAAWHRLIVNRPLGEQLFYSL